MSARSGLIPTARLERWQATTLASGLHIVLVPASSCCKFDTSDQVTYFERRPQSSGLAHNPPSLPAMQRPHHVCHKLLVVQYQAHMWHLCQTYLLVLTEGTNFVDDWAGDASVQSNTGFRNATLRVTRHFGGWIALAWPITVPFRTAPRTLRSGPVSGGTTPLSIKGIKKSLPYCLNRCHSRYIQSRAQILST